MNAQTGIRLKGEQVVQIPFQAPIRASRLLVRVVRPAVFLIDRPFVKKALMPLKPRLQGALKDHLAPLSFSVGASCHNALPAAVFGLRVR